MPLISYQNLTIAEFFAQTKISLETHGAMMRIISMLQRARLA
jgi:hypothetical protein